MKFLRRVLVLWVLCAIIAIVAAAQTDSTSIIQTYHVVRHIDPDFALEGEWREIWQTFDENNTLLEMVVVEGVITPQDITTTCNYVWRDSFSQAYNYTVDGNVINDTPVDDIIAALPAPFETETVFVSTLPCETTTTDQRFAVDANRCDFNGTGDLPSAGPSMNYTGVRWQDDTSDSVIGYILNGENPDVNFASRYDYTVNTRWSNNEIALMCFDTMLPLPLDSIVRSYTPTSFVVIDTQDSSSNTHDYFRNTLLQKNWIPVPEPNASTIESFIGGPNSLCQLDMGFFAYTNTSTIEIKVMSNAVSTQEILTVASSATNVAIVSAGLNDLDGVQQILPGTVPDNASLLVAEFEAEGWLHHEQLTIVYDDSALITLINDNYALHIWVENIGANQVEARFKLRELACGSAFFLPSD